MYKFIWVVFFLNFSFSFVIANSVFDCPGVSIDVDEDELEIDNLTAPIEIVKVFNASYNLIFQCNGNCPEEVSLENLAEGVYYIDIQSYTSNWRFICDKKETIIITNDNEPSCDNIGVEVNGDQMQISGLNAPNKIVKVFDVFYNLIDICFSDCGNTITIPNLLSGLYYVDIQLYTANWQFVCDLKDDVLIDLEEEPCDNSVCLGNVILPNQQAIDDFCGCTTIEGDLTIGSVAGSDINSLANLRTLERVNGKLSIKGTSIVDFDGLGNLGVVNGDLYLNKNLSLKHFQGLNNLVEIGGIFIIRENSKITDLSGLDRWTKALGIDFDKNSSLSKADRVAQISNLETIKLTSNAQLVALPPLTLLSALSGINISNNTKFKNLDFLSPIGYLAGNVTIKSNSSLTDCCGMSHLVDDDPFFGTNDAVFNISNNPFTCKSIPAILSDCQTSAPSCSDIQVNATGDKISISGLTAANVILKVFDKNYNVLYNCFGNCENSIQLDDLSNGTYRVSINFYNDNWIPICETIVTMVLTGNNATVSFSDRASDDNKFSNTNRFLIAPNPAYGATFLDLKEVVGKEVLLQLMNQFGQKVWAKEIAAATSAPEKIDLHTFDNGLYFLMIQPQGQRMVTQKLMVTKLY